MSNASQKKLYELIFKNATELMFLVSPDGVIKEANPSAKEFLTSEIVVGEDLFDFFNHGSKYRLKKLLAEIDKNDSIHQRIELVKNKKKHFFDVTGVSYIRSKLHLLVMRDVTAMVREKKAKDQFVAMAGHELKTPLAVIKAYSELLQKKVKEEKLKNYAEKVITKTDALTQYINAIIQEIKLGAGKLEFDDKEHDVKDLMTQVMQDLRKTYKKQKITYEDKLSANMILAVDKERFSQIITNLVSNAIKYSPKGEKIKITTEVSGNDLRVQIKDRGPGISKTEKQKIFNAFYRSKKTNKKGKSGLGLGLYIAESIVLRYGGEIGVKSKLGKGAAFYFTLPLC